MLSARELNIAGFPLQSKSWVNQHITYTHGYGVAMSAVNQVTKRRLPRLPRPGHPDGQRRPRDQAAAHLLRRARHRLQPRQDQQTRSSTTRAPTTPTSTRRTRAAAASRSPAPNRARLRLQVRHHQLLHDLGDREPEPDHHPQRHPRAHPRRGAVPRPRPRPLHGHRRRPPLVGPGRLHHDQPLPVLHAAGRPQLHPQLGQGRRGRLQRHHEVLRVRPRGPAAANVRGGVSVAVHAQERDAGGADSSTCATRRTCFSIQSEVYSTYHVDNVDVLYNKGDQWSIPTNVSLSGAGQMSPYYVIMRLPARPRRSSSSCCRSCPNTRQNMISWLGARSDVPNYGKALNFLFSKSSRCTARARSRRRSTRTRTSAPSARSGARRARR